LFPTRDLRAVTATIDGAADDFRRLAPNSFLRLAAAVETPPTPALLIDDPRVNPPEYEGWNRAAAGMSADIGVFLLADALYDGRAFVRDADGTALISAETTPRYWADALAGGATELLQEGTREQFLERPAIACMTPGLRAYGHWLLEILPRLWLARRVLGQAFTDHAVLIDEDTPDWALAMMRHAAGVQDHQIVRYYRAGTLLRVKRLVVPGQLHGDFHFHPFARTFYDGLMDAKRPDLPTVFQIPRPGHSDDPNDANRRLCSNAEALGAQLTARGVPVVAPERLSWAEQIALFRNATLVVGEYGSALHNAIFSGAGTRIVSFGFLNDVQSKIAAFRDQRIAYLAPQDERTEQGVRLQSFDPAALDLALDAALSP
jgi:capsular polysaccharide biosynthesis protein